MVLVPSASSDAAISFSTLFLAPPTATSPDNRVPPVTTNRSLTRLSVNSAWRPTAVSRQSARVRFCHGSSSDPHLHPHRRRRIDRAERFQQGVQERSSTRGVRRLRRGECRDRRRRLVGRPRRSGPGRVAADPERPLRRGRGPVHAGGREPRVPAAADHARTTSTDSSPGATSSTSRYRR